NLPKISRPKPRRRTNQQRTILGGERCSAALDTAHPKGLVARKRDAHPSREPLWNHTFKGDIFHSQAALPLIERLEMSYSPRHFWEESMRYLSRVTMFVALLLGASSVSWSAPRGQDSKETGTITGRVTIDGKPAQGVIVLAKGQDRREFVERMQTPSPSLRTSTDSDGIYRFDGLPIGKYMISVSAPALVSLEGPKGEKEVDVVADTTVEGIDFSLARAGVVTGRVTDSDGNPVVGAFIRLDSLEKSADFDNNMLRSPRMFFTDDRGVYRLFGISAGRYVVAASKAVDSSSFVQLLNSSMGEMTYYPGVPDRARAKPVEVAAGGEALAVDIKLGVPTKGFVVSGRVIEAESRKPVASALINYEAIARDVSDKNVEDKDDERLDKASGMTVTNARGEFRIESLQPGVFIARASWPDQASRATEFYTDPVPFEVRAANVENLQIEAHRGASISGVIVVENSESSELTEQISKLTIVAQVTDLQNNSNSDSSGMVSASGSFHIEALRAGKARIHVSDMGSPTRLSLARIERNGVDQQDGLAVRPNEQITGVRLVMTEANCVIRGHVILQGSLPPSSQTFALAQAVGGPIGSRRWTNKVDANGDFIIEGLPPGSYEVWASNYVVSAGAAKESMSGKQTVSVARGIQVEVTLLLDPNASGRDK
ncbi:MAG TPA: carboxypeptidase-like regulatory domain-containing protein, partial [Blastocatellia bacterium]|nr:carboxypeptidase-like regulatory domain-containing protein [Blastocatellia bacterium]